MFSIFYPNKDTIITNVSINGSSPKTGSNQGSSEILDLYVLPEASSSATQGISRVLLQFDLEQLSQSLVDGDVPSSGVQYILSLIDAPHRETRPTSFDIVVAPMSRSWDEGRGLSKFDENLQDAGFANWDNATSLVSWSVTGSDYISQSVSASQHFDGGEEDLEVDVSDIVGQWLTGGLSNNGVIIKYLDAHETGSLELFTKQFFSRHTLRPDRRPKLIARWTDFLQDDRDNMKYGVSGCLAYYRIINGFGQNAAGSVYVDVIDSGSNVVQTLTASLNKAGLYEASGVFVTFTASTEIYRDVWFTDNEQLFTGTFCPLFATGSDEILMDDMVLDLPNLKRVYPKNDRTFIRVFARPKDYRPALRRSGSVHAEPTFLKEAFYEIRHESTNKVLVPFSTGAVKFSKLSYDRTGNYFELDTSNLIEENLYRIRILAKFNRQEAIFDKDWVLKIE